MLSKIKTQSSVCSFDGFFFLILSIIFVRFIDSLTHQCVVSLVYLADFWTTKCTRCPDALTKLDQMAQDPQYANIQFISICCDKLDGAREIIEKDDELRWQHVSHYFMEPDNKEIAKKILAFTSVPFYVVLNNLGDITQLGGHKKIDFDALPGKIISEAEKENSQPTNKDDFPADNQKQLQPEEDRAFVLDDFDF